MGTSPEQAFYVKCDEETNPPEVIDAGQLVVEIGLAPVKPAEFVIFRIGQMAQRRRRRRVTSVRSREDFPALCRNRQSKKAGRPFALRRWADPTAEERDSDKRQGDLR